MEPKWLTVEMVRALHAEGVARFGGSAELRDGGLLDSGLERARNLYAYGDDPSLFDLAAAACAGIVKNHPFVDGNKRAGALAAAVFLDLNGYDFRPPETVVVTVIMALAAGEIEEDVLARWFSDFSTRRRE
jgi:death-on-curing protein